MQINKTNNDIETISSIPGSGKTEVVLNELKNSFINDKIHGKNVIVCPTTLLIKSISERLTSLNLEHVSLHSNSENLSGDTVKDSVINYYQNNDNFILIITCETFKTVSSSLNDTDMLIIDEKIDEEYHYHSYKEKTSIDFFNRYFTIEKTLDNKNYGILKLRNRSNLNTCDSVVKDHFSKITKYLRDEYIIIAKTTVNDESHLTLEYCILPNPKYFFKGKRVIYMGNDLESQMSTILYKNLFNIEFKKSPLQNNLRFTSYTTKVKINYMFDGVLGNYKISYQEEEQRKQFKNYVENISVPTLFSCQENKWKISPIKNSNLETIPKNPVGIDKPSWSSYNNVTLLTNTIISPTEYSFYVNLLGEEYSDHIKNQRQVENLFQSATRGSIRNNSPYYEITVYSEYHARQLSKFFPNSTLYKITDHDIVLISKKKGKTSYISTSEKKIREKIRNRIYYLKNKNSLTLTEQNQLLSITKKYYKRINKKKEYTTSLSIFKYMLSKNKFKIKINNLVTKYPLSDTYFKIFHKIDSDILYKI